MLSRLDYSYNSGDSIVHRLNPVVKLLGFIIYVLICFLEFDYLLFVVSTVFVFMLLLISNISIIRYLKIAGKLWFVVIVMYVFMRSKNMAIMDMSIVVCKLVFSILYLMMIIYTTTKKDLGNGSARILDIFNLVGISFKKISSFFISMYVYLGIFIDTYIEVFTNLEIKGKDYSHSNIVDRIRMFFKNIKVVFKKTNDKMKSRKIQMKYRLYKSNVKSKYKYRNKLCIFDYIFIIVNIGMLVFYIVKVRL